MASSNNNFKNNLLDQLKSYSTTVRAVFEQYVGKFVYYQVVRKVRATPCLFYVGKIVSISLSKGRNIPIFIRLVLSFPKINSAFVTIVY